MGDEVSEKASNKKATFVETDHKRSSDRLSSEENAASLLSLGPSQEPDINPFNLVWTFGVNTSVDVINLTSRSRSLLFYACTHASILYDYVAHTMNVLQGHKNMITSISSDDSGRWLATADEGEDNTIIVWDSFECVPVNTIFDSHPKHGAALCAISGNAKYLVSVGNEFKHVIKFWLWTYGDNEPNDSFTANDNYGLPRRICFNPDVQEHIWVAFQKQMIFIEWDTNQNRLLPPVFPTIRNFKKHGLITDCTYFLKCHECVASTTEGVLLVFGNTLYAKEYEESKLQNTKIFVKAIKVSDDSITCVTSVDGLLVSGDDRGRIKFYDNRVKIMYWCQSFNLPLIKSISFHMEKRNYKIEDPSDVLNPQINPLDADDNYAEVELFYINQVPTDATVNKLPFIVRDFFVATEDSRIGLVDYVKNKITFVNRKIQGIVTSIDTHEEHPFVCMGLKNGVVCLFDFATKILLAETCLTDKNQAMSITYVKYSPKSLYLACGTLSGHLYFLDPIALIPKFENPIHVIQNSIIKIVFSADSKFCAYYNSCSTIVILKYLLDVDIWEVVGKMVSHYKCINDILFTPYLPSRLFTIGADRMLQEYDLINSGNNEIVLVASERIEQCAIPIAFIYYQPADKGESKYFYICDNQYKYKVLNDTTFMCHRVVLGPAYGCYEKSQVNKIQILPKHDNKYMIYANDNYFGIQMFPADGNPHKYIGTTAHPTQLVQFRISCDGKYVFTIGKNDNCMLMWEINTEAVEATYRNGGVVLEPYYCLIEGGLNGWLFKEMQDLFYYMQILHQGENTVLPRNVSDCIPVSELPDLMRAVGFYPSEYEIENMIVDLKYRDFDLTKTLKDEVSFLEFIQLYINYRPPHGISIEKLQEQFEFLCSLETTSPPGTISREGFINAISEKGETFTRNKAYTCLATLMRDDDVPGGNSFSKDFSFLPIVIDFKTFLEDMLGIDLERQMVVNKEKPEGVAEEMDC
ncbi:hypothetical protein RN001_011628 [Aquatica leii]|uniref:Cilia- and flagella-associated protein 251 n=1 Tax=Aquatica leii TaxID=1421715 RepID=A0AAN7S7H5_9COLE|nr:hypothetical protein RN001_011628 [Aquatica leii]